MPTRTARTAWTGGLNDGTGRVELVSSGLATYDVSFPRRTADTADGTTSPEELIAAAHPAGGLHLTGIALTVRGRVEGLDAAGFEEAANAAKDGCPVSKALTGVEITLDAALES